MPEIDPNPPIITWTKKDGVLEKETTHAQPKIYTESFLIEAAQAQIDKIDGVIAQWEVKRKVHQDLIDKYEALIL